MIETKRGGTQRRKQITVGLTRTKRDIGKMSEGIEITGTEFLDIRYLGKGRRVGEEFQN